MMMTKMRMAWEGSLTYFVLKRGMSPMIRMRRGETMGIMTMRTTRRKSPFSREMSLRSLLPQPLLNPSTAPQPLLSGRTVVEVPVV